MKGPPKATSMELNLAPMVDVIMCMLIFFMLATKLVQRESSRIDLPLALAAKSTELADLGSRFVINVRNVGADEAGASGSEVEYVVFERSVALPELINLLGTVAKRAATDSGGEVNCVIRADKTVPYRHVEAVMVACAKAQIRNLTFSALQGAGGSP